MGKITRLEYIEFITSVKDDKELLSKLKAKEKFIGQIFLQRYWNRVLVDNTDTDLFNEPDIHMAFAKIKEKYVEKENE